MIVLIDEKKNDIGDKYECVDKFQRMKRRMVRILKERKGDG